MTNEELVATLSKRFDQLDARFTQVDARFAGIDTRLDALGEDVHQTRILVEDFDRQVGLLQDGIQNVDEKLGRFRDETDQNFTELRDRLLHVEVRGH